MAELTEIRSIFKKCYEFTVAADARAQGLYPYFRPIEKSDGTKVIIEGREVIMAGSNNYLGLSLDPRVREAAISAVEEYGTSCSGSRFMNGTLDLHEELEERLAEFTHKPAAAVFTTGYQTNLGSISALVGRGEHVFTDKLNHASIMDGIFMSIGMNHNVNVHRYKHNDMEDLEKKLLEVDHEAAKLIVTDGVFSMEGDIVDLPELKGLANRYNAGVYLDEAHSIGVLGATGRGTGEYYEDMSLADVVMCTFSKSFGSIGGFVSGEPEVIDYIQHFARPLIFSASIPPASIAAVIAALDIIIQEPERVARLQEIGKKMGEGFRDLGFDVGNTQTPVVPLIIGDYDKTFLFWKNLYERGVYVNPVVSPAVPPNKSLIRTSYMATHTDEELDIILDISAQEGRRLGII